MIFEALELAGLLNRKRWPLERLDELRRAKLRKLIDHAYHAVPFYRRLMDRAGVKPAQIRAPSDLAKLPITTKKDLRQAGGDCLATGHGELTVLHTSGHSDAPFEVRMTPAEYRTRPARLHRWLGFYRMEVIPLVLPREEQLRRLRLSRPDVLWAYPSTLQSLLHIAGCELRDQAQPRILITSSEVMRPLFGERLRRHA